MIGRLWVMYLSLYLSALILWFLSFLTEKVFAREFEMLYTTHGLKHHSRRRRPLYLHYACFLRALTDRTAPISQKTIRKLRRFADIAEQPPLPESQLLQPVYIVPFIAFLSAIFLEVIKGTKIFETSARILPFVLAVYVLIFAYGVLRGWHLVSSWTQSEKHIIQRFLQWAERDIAEEKFLRTQRLHAAMPDSQRP
jgi:hypothetical protein